MRIYEMLTRTLYAEHVERADRGVTIRNGVHEAPIDFSTFQDIQDRLRRHS